MHGPNKHRRRRFLIHAGTGIVALAASLALGWYARHVLLLIFAGILLALLLQSLGKWICSLTPLSYRWALFVTVLILISAAGLALWLFGNRIAGQAVQLSNTLPISIDQMRKQMEQSEEGKLLAQQLTKIGQWITSGDAMGQLTSGAMTAVDGFIALVIIGFIGLYGAISPQLYIDGAIQLINPKLRERSRAILSNLAHDLRHWMLGHLITMFIVGLMASIGLSLLNIPEAFVLGLLAFFAELIPYIGPVVAALPAIILGWSQSPMSAIYVMLLYLGIHIVEGYLLFPWIMRRAIRMPPALTICGVVFFGLIGGLLGAILATPLTLVLVILVKRIYVEAILENNATTL